MISEWNQLIVSVKFAFGKVHLWVLLHKPAKQILFLLIFFYFKNEHICIHSCWMNKNNEYSELTEPHIPVLWEGSWCFTEKKKRPTDSPLKPVRWRDITLPIISLTFSTHLVSFVRLMLAAPSPSAFGHTSFFPPSLLSLHPGLTTDKKHT